MSNCVILLEDDPDLATLVRELLQDADYNVVHVITVEALLAEAARRSPCVALVDGTSPSQFDLWWLGPILSKMGVPPLAFTAHASARAQFEEDAHEFVGVLSKPFDADQFIEIVNGICWEGQHEAAAS